MGENFKNLIDIKKGRITRQLEQLAKAGVEVRFPRWFCPQANCPNKYNTVCITLECHESPLGAALFELLLDRNRGNLRKIHGAIMMLTRLEQWLEARFAGLERHRAEAERQQARKLQELQREAALEELKGETK